MQKDAICILELRETGCKPVNSNRSLVGLFFHSFNDSKVVENQGVVIGQITDCYFLVRLFDWITGEDSSIYVRSVFQFMDYRFYDTCKEMKDFYHANREPIAQRDP